MAAPVWTLSVDLTTKTASFTTGMADAAKTARSTFQSIRESAREGGAGVKEGTINAQQALGVLSNTMRGDVEGAFMDLVREMSHTSAVMAAIPFAAMAGGVLLVVNLAVEAAAKIKEWREEHEKLTNAQTRFETAANDAFNSLDQKLIAAKQKTAELAHNDMAALEFKLRGINTVSLEDLRHQFETITKAAEDTFKMLEGHWYTFGIGSAGASHALEQFKVQYDNLLSKGNEKGAGDLLKGTLDSAEKVLAAQKAMANSRGDNGLFGRSVDYSAQFQAMAVLRAAGVGYTEKEREAQEQLVGTLQRQATAQAKISDLKKIDSDNAKKETAADGSARTSEAAKQAAASQLAIKEAQLQADRSFAAQTLEIQRATIQQRLDSDLAFADRDYAIKEAARVAEIAALDKAGKDYQNQLKALQDKEHELTAAHIAAVAELRSRSAITQNAKDLADYQQSEREKLAATMEGSAERLAVLDQSIKDAQVRQLQDTDYYRQLSSQRVEAARQASELELRERLGGIQSDERLAKIRVAAEMEQAALLLTARQAGIMARTQAEVNAANAEYEVQREALQKQLAALEQFSDRYSAQIAETRNRQRELEASHQTQIATIQARGAVLRATEQRQALAAMEASFAQSALRILSGQQTFSQMLGGIMNQLAGNLLQAAIMQMNHLDSTKLSEAKAAGRQGYLMGLKFPFPANLVAAPALAAGAFASVMAFAAGTDNVPGVGRADVVPAMLTPGEGVVPGGVMDGLRNVARNGGFDRGQGPMTVRYAPTFHVEALDADGVEGVLRKHHETFARHFENTLRKYNR